MRNLMRNCQPVFYRLYEGEQEILDEYGNSTGSYYPAYSELKSDMLCVSPNKGSSEINQFGTLLDYDRTMTTADINCKIDENSVLWVDGADTNGAWNYKVISRAPWKNSILYAIKRVNVSAYNEVQQQIKSAMQMMEKAKEHKAGSIDNANYKNDLERTVY